MNGYFDRHFTVARTWADPRMVDPAVEPSRRPAGMCYRGTASAANRSGTGLAGEVTLRNWLHMWSLADSPCRAEPYLAKITVPTLVMNPEGDEGVFPGDAQAIFDAIPSADKLRVDLPGDHYFRQPESARDTVADVIADWVSARFPVR